MELLEITPGYNGSGGSSQLTPSKRVEQLRIRECSKRMIVPGSEVIQLDRNESAFPLPSAWIEAGIRSLNTATSYPDPECEVLRRAIADRFCLDYRRIYIGAGIFECLQSLALAFLDPCHNVVIPEHAFFFFRHVANLAGAEVKFAAERNLAVDIDAILDAVDPFTRMVILANPGNPTGSYIPRNTIECLRNKLPPGVLLVVDEAYADYVCESRYDTLFDLVDSANVLILRTFSKLYGLAGYRVAWCYCPEGVIESMRQVQIPAIVNVVGQALARAAIEDEQFARSCKQEVAAVKTHFVERLAGLERAVAVPSETNFVLLRTRSSEEAAHLHAFLLSRGIVLNRQMTSGLRNCIRGTIGTQYQMNFVSSAIIDWATQ